MPSPSRSPPSWEALGFTVTLVETDPGTSLTERLREGKFTAAVIDISIGLDPDLYPLLASSQTRTGGLNLIGLQDSTLDGLLAAARKPGTPEARKAAYTALQTQLSTRRIHPPASPSPTRSSWPGIPFRTWSSSQSATPRIDSGTC